MFVCATFNCVSLLHDCMEDKANALCCKVINLVHNRVLSENPMNEADDVVQRFLGCWFQIDCGFIKPAVFLHLSIRCVP